MNPRSNMQQLVYVVNSLFSIDCFITDLQLQAKDKLAETEKVERALLNLRLQLRRSFDEWLGVFAPEEGEDA